MVTLSPEAVDLFERLLTLSRAATIAKDKGESLSAAYDRIEINADDLLPAAELIKAGVAVAEDGHETIELRIIHDKL